MKSECASKIKKLVIWGPHDAQMTFLVIYQIQNQSLLHATFDKSFAQGGVDWKENKGQRGIPCLFVPQPLQKRKSIQVRR